MREISYNRTAAVHYARTWAYGRNPKFYDFSNLGGDCTNFISQCIYAGIGVMNFTKTYGWYYISTSERTASWTGVEYLKNFILNNSSVGPYGHLAGEEEAEPGDVVQLENAMRQVYHSLLITETTPDILVATHSFDALDRPLSSYNFYNAHFIHIDGGRTW